MAFPYLEAVLGEFLLPSFLILRGFLLRFLRFPCLILCFWPWSRDHEVIVSVSWVLLVAEMVNSFFPFSFVILLYLFVLLVTASNLVCLVGDVGKCGCFFCFVFFSDGVRLPRSGIGWIPSMSLLILRGVLLWFLWLLILCFSPWSRNHEVLASSFLEFFWLRKWWIRFAFRFFYSFIEIVSCSGDNIRLVCLVRNAVSLCCWSIVSWVASCSWWFGVCLLLLVFLLWWFVNLGLSGD